MKLPPARQSIMGAINEAFVGVRPSTNASGWPSGTCTTAATVPAKPAWKVLDEMLAAKEELERTYQPDLIAWQMTRQGFDPQRGGLLYLPDTKQWRDACGSFPAPYIRFSPHVAVPTMVNHALGARVFTVDPIFNMDAV